MATTEVETEVKDPSACVEGQRYHQFVTAHVTTEFHVKGRWRTFARGESYCQHCMRTQNKIAEEEAAFLQSQRLDKSQ